MREIHIHFTPLVHMSRSETTALILELKRSFPLTDDFDLGLSRTTDGSSNRIVLCPNEIEAEILITCTSKA